ncbi:MAG TPA: DUF3300 domain-containing protein [Gemmatimonadaceae bacterium]|nr:DUF3300 domain-containing protein [Gemmatimonadaceae bacterium]
MKAITGLAACAIVLAGCRGKKQEASAGDAVVAPTTTAMPVTQASWDPDAIDELVAPIALYPDQLVGQILAASANTQEVLDAGNWLLENQTLKGDQLDAAAQKAGFGPATRALVQFPTVVDMMCQEIDWTKQLGAAFTSDQKGVLDAIQRLRAQASDVGNLQTTPQQTVEHKQEEGKEIIEVKPADPKVVYVPQYDPTIIYTTPPSAAPAPAPAPAPQPNTVSTSTAIAGGLLAFGVGVLVGSAINDNDYYYPHYGPGAVYYGPRPFYPPAYVYRPVYGPAFHPAYRYAPPASYRYRYNSPTNIVINNNNYYNRFSNQNNLRVNNQRNVTAGNRVGQPGNAGRGQNWKGQSTYAGARAGGAADRKAGVNNRAANVSDRRASTPDRKATPQRNQAAAAQRPAPAKSQPRTGQRPNAVASTNSRDRGYGTGSQAGSRDAPNRQVATGEVATRDAGNANRTQPKAAASAPRENALSGASREGSGSFDRAASARGHASASATRERPSRGGRRP